MRHPAFIIIIACEAPAPDLVFLGAGAVALSA